MRKRLPALVAPVLLAGCQGGSSVDSGDATKLFYIVGGLFVIIIVAALVIHSD